MENKPSGETSWSRSAESKNDKSEKKDSATSKTALSLGKVAERPFFSRNETAAQERQQTVWERLRGEESKSEESKAESPVPAESEPAALPMEQLRQVIADHRETLTHERREFPAGQSEQGARVLGVQAESLLLDNTDALSHVQPETNPDAVINNAYDRTATQVQEAFHPGMQAETSVPVGPEESPRSAAVSETAFAPPPPAGETGGGNVPPRTPEEPESGQPDEPEDPRLQGAVSPSPARTETASATNTEQNDWYYAGRRRGTIAGLAVGYFAGRRGGRKRAERRFNAQRKRFEKHTAALSAALESKEHQIRRLTEQQAETTPPKQYPKIIERLQTVAPAREERPVNPPPVIEKPQVAANRRAQPERQTSQAEPAPAETAPRERSRYAEVVPFTKTSAELTWRELKAIAEKIKVDDNLTLKDMYEAHRFDEKAFRRIVSVFLEGGDIRRAITYEVTEHDKNFERDPLFRRKHDSGGLDGGGRVEQAVVQSKAAGGASGPITTPFKQIEGRPEPSPEIVKAIKQRQATSVAVAALLIIALILLVLALSR